MNTSGIRPMEYNILVKPDPVEATTKGGLIIPESKKEKDGFARTEGTLVAISPMSFMNSDWPVSMDHLKPKPGDRVIFSRYQATQVKGKDGEDYWLMKDASIAGVME